MEVNGMMNRSNIGKYIIRKVVYEDMIEYCFKNLPYESCGLLSGGKGTGMRLWKMENQSKELNRFYMSKESIKGAAKKMGEYAEHLTGIFHSHPNTPALPSSQDIINNPYTELAYIIVSFYKGKVDVACFKTDGQTAIPLNLIVIDV